MNVLPLRKPSAVLPLAMSLLALSIVLYHAARFGTDPEPDECTAAHLFHLLVAAQVPVVGFFALKWMPVCPKETVHVLALQALALVAAFAGVYFLT